MDVDALVTGIELDDHMRGAFRPLPRQDPLDGAVMPSLLGIAEIKLRIMEQPTKAAGDAGNVRIRNLASVGLVIDPVGWRSTLDEVLRNPFQPHIRAPRVPLQPTTPRL